MIKSQSHTFPNFLKKPQKKKKPTDDGDDEKDEMSVFSKKRYLVLL